MKLLLDENLPHQLRHELPDRDCFTVAYMGWGGVANGTPARLGGRRCNLNPHISRSGELAPALAISDQFMLPARLEDWSEVAAVPNSHFPMGLKVLGEDAGRRIAGAACSTSSNSSHPASV